MYTMLCTLCNLHNPKLSENLSTLVPENYGLLSLGPVLVYMHWGTKDSIWGPGLKQATVSAHFQWKRWRTCYLFNKMDGVPGTGSPCGPMTV